MCDYDPPAIAEHKEVKARKAHRCLECREDILVGDRYVRSNILYDGAWFNSKTCLPCWSLWSEVQKFSDCVSMGELAESMAEMASGSGISLGKLEGFEEIKVKAPASIWNRMIKADEYYQKWYATRVS